MHQRDPQHPGWLSVAHAHRASSLATGVRCCLVSGVLKAAASRPKELLAPAVLPGGVATPRRLLVGLMGIHRHADSPESSRIVREATQHPAKPGIVELRLRRATLGHALAKGHGVWFKTLDDTLGQGVDKALLPSTQPFPKAPALENTTGAVHSTGLLAVHPEAPAGQAPHPGRAGPCEQAPQIAPELGDNALPPGGQDDRLLPQGESSPLEGTGGGLIERGLASSRRVHC